MAGANRRLLYGSMIAMGVAGTVWLLAARPQSAPPGEKAKASASPLGPRLEALSRAQVWRRPSGPLSRYDFSVNPPDPQGTLSAAAVRCTYIVRKPTGTTPKFDCRLANGETVRVKYGGTPEIQAEIAATRLLTALGFGADRVYSVRTLRCYGCPREPFYTAKLLKFVPGREVVLSRRPDDRYIEFDWVGVERRMEGEEIKAGDEEGWGWYELTHVDPSRGADASHLDALRLLAMFLAHWDNKSANQRLMCLSAGAKPDAPCQRPFAYIQDLGASFGPNKVNLANWSSTRVWTDARKCTVSMKAFPYEGSTFPDVRISEPGRLLLARGLSGLTREQLTALFTAARFGPPDSPGNVQPWVEAFEAKVREVVNAGPCPS